jgi:hypothetical protein
VVELRSLVAEALAAAKSLYRMPGRVEVLQREVRLLNRQLSLPPEDAWRGPPSALAAEPGVGVFSHCQVCRQEDFAQPYFGYWTTRAELGPNLHRKVWEFVYICQALHERGLLRPGARGLGFGVGGEPLPAFFAGQGCSILATDQARSAAAASGWAASQQHASERDSLGRPSMCPPEQFDANVAFRACDMNAIPADMTGHDFCWSACALEHLGSIEHGLRFIENSLATLKPGGFAVHTTEFNLSSNDETLAHGGTVLFRQRDMEELSRRLAAKGHIMAPLDLDRGQGLLDRYIDMPPYRQEPHLKLALEGFEATSIGIVVQRAP